MGLRGEEKLNSSLSISKLNQHPVSEATQMAGSVKVTQRLAHHGCTSR
jgi:hypothetical protein